MLKLRAFQASLQASSLVVTEFVTIAEAHLFLVISHERLRGGYTR